MAGAKDEVLDLYYQQGTNRPRPTIVWVHGGGFLAGSKNGIANYMKVLAGMATRWSQLNTRKLTGSFAPAVLPPATKQGTEGPQ